MQKSLEFNLLFFREKKNTHPAVNPILLTLSYSLLTPELSKQQTIGKRDRAGFLLLGTPWP